MKHELTPQVLFSHRAPDNAAELFSVASIGPSYRPEQERTQRAVRAMLSKMEPSTADTTRDIQRKFLAVNRLLHDQLFEITGFDVGQQLGVGEGTPYAMGGSTVTEHTVPEGWWLLGDMSHIDVYACATIPETASIDELALPLYGASLVLRNPILVRPNGIDLAYAIGTEVYLDLQDPTLQTYENIVEPGKA